MQPFGVNSSSVTAQDRVADQVAQTPPAAMAELHSLRFRQVSEWSSPSNDRSGKQVSDRSWPTARIRRHATKQSHGSDQRFLRAADIPGAKSRSAPRSPVRHLPRSRGIERCFPAYGLQYIGWTISRAGLCPVRTLRPDLLRPGDDFTGPSHPLCRAIPPARRTSWNIPTR